MTGRRASRGGELPFHDALPWTASDCAPAARFKEFVKGGLVVAVSDNMTFEAGYENRIFPISLIVIGLVLVLGGGFGYWYYASQKLNHIAKDAPHQIPSNFKAPEFEAVYAQLGDQPPLSGPGGMLV